MDIKNVSQLYQSKLQEINQRLPSQTIIKDKFASYLESAKLQNTSSENIATNKIEENNATSNLDSTQLLNSLLTSQSVMNSTTGLFSNNTSSDNMFPSMNSSLQVLQQAALLKSLKSNNE